VGEEFVGVVKPSNEVDSTVMVGSYMDESFDPTQSGIFAVGGILGRGVAIFELERRWEQLFARQDINIAYFKASECQNGKGEFRKFVADPKSITQAERSKLDSISHEFLNLISRPVPFDSTGYMRSRRWRRSG
jgi:hypothetical protein